MATRCTLFFLQVSGLRPKIQDAGMSEARDVDLFFMGNRQAKHRLDEVDRIVRWGRLAPPFGARVAGGTDMKLDDQLLCDHWAYEVGVRACCADCSLSWLPGLPYIRDTSLCRRL